MALIKCPECGKENISDKAVACPVCAFPIREEFLATNVVDDNGNEETVQACCPAINPAAEIESIRHKAHAFFVSYAKYWYAKNRDVFDRFYASSVSVDEIMGCNDDFPGTYEVIDYFFDVFQRIDNSCKNKDTFDLYENIIVEAIHIAKEKAGAFLSFGCMTYLLKAINYEKLSKGAIISIARIISTDCMFTIWTRSELDVLFQHLNTDEKQQCMLFWGNRYKYDTNLRVNSKGMYKAWLECKEKGVEFDVKDTERFQNTDVGNIILPMSSASIITTNNANVPKCPTCSSTKIHKISAISKVGSVALWGIFSRKVHKQWHCDSCGSEW